MERHVIILVVLTLLFDIEFFGQEIPQKKNSGINIEKRIQNKGKQGLFPSAKQYQMNRLQPSFPVLFLSISTPASQSCKGIEQSFYTNGLGFFCRKELEIEKLSSIPFRFRLGSLAYVDYLEQKPNSHHFFRNQVQ